MRLGTAGAVAAGLVGCASIAGVDGDYLPLASDGGVVEAAVDAPAGSDAGPLPPRLVPVAGEFSIGVTEVTRASYEAWLASRPATAGQSSACAGNTTFIPDASCMLAACSGSGCGEHPQVCVTWCDAVAYCAAAGQRLCGQIGGGNEKLAEYKTSASSQWHSVCTGRGDREFPYGETFVASRCNGAERPEGGATLPVGALRECAAPALLGDVVLDLSGNAWEWTDACEGSGSDARCRIRGGSYRTAGADQMRCAGDGTSFLGRAGSAPDVGFRCCSR